MLRKVVLERRNNGFKDVIICLGCEGEIGTSLQQKGIVVHYLCINSIKTSFVSIFKLNKLVKYYNPSIVQTWLYHSDLLGGFIGFLNKKTVIWNIRQTKFNSYRSLITIIIMRLCAVLSYFIPKVIICAANSSKESHIKYGYCASKFKVIPNGFIEGESYDKETKNKLKEDLQIQENEIVIGTVGRFHVDKGYEYFIEATSIVYKKNLNIKFIMVGKDLDTKNLILLNWIKTHNLENRFILIGKSENVNLYLSIFDVFCLSSISEGFPNVIGEAMLQAKPCVVTDCGDSRLIVGDTGYVAKVKNPQDLGDKLIEMIKIGEIERSKMGLKAKARIKQNFMINNIVKKYTDTYNYFSK